jgi:cytochrome oxidase assembly protein ShyY1
MYSFLRKPAWLAFLLLGVVGAIGMPILGQWQVNRYHETQAANKKAAARAAASPVPLRVALPDSTNLADGTKLDGQRVTETGTYDLEHQILIDLKSYKGHPGYHVLTPLRTEDGRAVLVARGWVPQETAVDAPRPKPIAPTETVSIEGRVRATQVRGALGPKASAQGTLDVMTRVDIARIAQQIPYRLTPVYLELLNQDPPASTDLSIIEAQTRDAGTNLSYAMQWFLFTIIGLIAWPIIIRREAGRRQKKKGS